MSIVFRLRNFFERMWTADPVGGVGFGEDLINNNHPHQHHHGHSDDQLATTSSFNHTTGVASSSSSSFNPFRGIHLSTSKCAYCRSQRKSINNDQHNGSLNSTLTRASKRLQKVDKDPLEENKQQQQEDVDKGGVIHQPNLKVVEGVRLYESRALSLKNPSASATATTSTDRPEAAASPQPMPAAPIDSTNVSSPSLENSSASIKSNPLLLLHEPPLIAPKAEMDEMPDDCVFDPAHIGGSMRIKTTNITKSSITRNQQRKLVNGKLFLPLSASSGGEEEDSKDNDKVKARKKVLLPRGRYQSLLLTDTIPFYQVYNQKALDGDVALAQRLPNRKRFQRDSEPAIVFPGLSTADSINLTNVEENIETISPSTPPLPPASASAIRSATHSVHRSVDLHMYDEVPFDDDEEEEQQQQEQQGRNKNKTHEEEEEDQLKSHLHDRSAMMTPIQDVIAANGPGGVRWCSMPPVVDLALHKTLSPSEIKRQEALFEIITSEASYLRSLKVLMDNYVNAPEFDCTREDRRIVVQIERHLLFSNIAEIVDTSAKFFNALEHRWLENPILDDLCDIVRDFAHEDFKCFVPYLKNQHYQNDKLNELMQRSKFMEAIRRIQANSQCPTLTLQSFLLLPMQRICRLQLLVKAVLHRTLPTSNDYVRALVAMGAIEKILGDCDREKKFMHQRQRILQWCNRLDFRSYVKTISLGDADRQVMKLGKLGVLHAGRHSSTAFKRSFIQIRMPIATVILLNDYVLLAKQRKSTNNATVTAGGDLSSELNIANRHIVEDAAPRTKVTCHCASKQWKESHRHLLCDAEQTTTTTATATTKTTNPSSTAMPISFSPSNQEDTADIETIRGAVPPGPYIIHLILRPQEKDQCEYHLDAGTFSNMERWLDAFAGLNSDNKQFEDFVSENCKQAVVKRSYLAMEDDELDLKDGETIVILQILPEGWCKGMTRDNRRGWFPSSHAALILNDGMKTNQADLTQAISAYDNWRRKQQIAAAQ